MMEDEKGEASKAKIVEAAGELFWKQGYAATGIRDILDATGLPKGSFTSILKVSPMWPGRSSDITVG